MKAELKRRRDERKAALKEAEAAKRLLRERTESVAQLATSHQQAMEEQRRECVTSRAAATDDAPRSPCVLARPRRYEARLEQGAQEIRDLQAEFERERSSLLDTVREQNRELGLLLQLADTFLTPHEMGKVGVRARGPPSATRSLLTPAARVRQGVGASRVQRSARRVDAAARAAQESLAAVLGVRGAGETAIADHAGAAQPGCGVGAPSGRRL